MNLNAITLRGVKQHTTMDGVAFVANIFYEGKKIGHVEQGGYGGPNEYYFLNKDHRKDFPEACKAWYKEQYPEETGPYIETEDIFIEALLGRMDKAKWFKRNCKNKTLFRVAGDAEGSWHTIPAPYSPACQVS